jgi:ubiquinone/menaquinone biosynthesis C-methylase UbiE
VQDHESLIRSEFSRQASAMANAALFNDENVLTRIREAAQLTINSRVLDVACGPGIVVEALARVAGEAVGCDITPEMLEKTRKRCASTGLINVRCLQGRAEALPFDDASFDAVISRSAVHHFVDPVAAFSEMARVAKRGGRVVTVDVTSSDLPEEAALHNALEALRDPSHVRMLPKVELHGMLTQVGLTVESCLEWINNREFDEWLKIASAPERAGPLKVIMSALARCGATAGIDLCVEGEKILFKHHAALTTSVKS